MADTQKSKPSTRGGSKQADAGKQSRLAAARGSKERKASPRAGDEKSGNDKNH